MAEWAARRADCPGALAGALALGATAAGDCALPVALDLGTAGAGDCAVAGALALGATCDCDGALGGALAFDGGGAVAGAAGLLPLGALACVTDSTVFVTGRTTLPTVLLTARVLPPEGELAGGWLATTTSLAARLVGR